MSPIEIPRDVLEWLGQVFVDCDRRISVKLSNNPNLPEESLDLTWIEHLTQYTSPVVLRSHWTIEIQTHYLGGMRHFYNWEIADVGLLLFVRRGQEGSSFESISDERIQNLFYRRSGPIAAAIAITIDAP